MSILFDVPAQFANEALYTRVGAVIKDKVTGHIVAHVQETGLWGLARHLPLPGGGPLNLITQGIQIFQLAKIQRTLDTVQTLATVGAVASVASLGVSIAGFGLVLARLGRMDQKLDRVLTGSKVLQRLSQQLHLKLDALQFARLRAELESVGMATRFDAARRKESLQRSIAELSTLRHYYGDLLADPALAGVGTQDAVALLDAHERLTAAAEGELYSEFLLGSDPDLLAERWQRQRDIFDRVAWQNAADLYGMLEEADKANGVYLVTSAKDRAATAKSLIAIRRESLDRLASLPLLAAEVSSRGMTALEYMKAVENARDADEPLLVLEAKSS